MIGAKSIILNEDDVWEIPFFTKYGIKYCNTVLSPISCGSEPYDYKTIKYPGFHELAYLHPNHFTPNREVVERLGDTPYFILRFSSLDAHHDDNRTGITDELATSLIEILKPHGRVYITSERPLRSEFDDYRIGIHPKDMHHAMAFADLYIGDSQTMAAEAAVLGTPSLRFNDFVGKLGYLDELEHKYGLTFGFKTTQKDKLLNKVSEIVNDHNAKILWPDMREQMLKERVDVARFWTWFFVNYPASLASANYESFDFETLAIADQKA